MKKVAFIVRGTIKKPDVFRSNISRLFNRDFDVILKFTRHQGHAIPIVKELMEAGLDYLVPVGGDGTFSDVINAYMSFPLEIRSKTVIIPFPRGTGNDFTRTLGRVNNMDELYYCITNKTPFWVDAVHTSWINDDGSPGERFYNNSFDVGLGGVVSEMMNKSNKHWGSNLTYIINIVNGFIRFKRPVVEVISDDLSFKREVLLVSFANGKYFGSGLCIAPDASLTDGRVSVTIVGKVSVVTFLKNLNRLKKGLHIKHREVSYHSLSSCTINPISGRIPMEFDGEVTGNLPLKLTVIPNGIQVLSPL